MCFAGEVPTIVTGAHYFTRNRTHGSDFPNFFPRKRFRTSLFGAFLHIFWATGKNCSSSLDGYDSHEADLLLVIYLRDWRATCASNQLGKI